MASLLFSGRFRVRLHRQPAGYHRGNPDSGDGGRRPGFSRRSRLIDVILGVGSAAGDLAHPQDVAALTDEEKSWFITWVDLGAQYR